MAQSLSHILIHVIFSTKDRTPFIKSDIKSQLHAYLASTCRNLKCECFRVGGVENHVHLALELPRTFTLSKLLETLKSSSSEWLKSQSPELNEFAWQGGYGAFSFSFSHLNALCSYIDQQEEHHKKVTFQEEYLNLLEKLNIEYDPQYIWTP